MGCSIGIGVDPKIKNLITELDEKIDDFYKTFIKEVEEVKKKQEKQLNKRHEDLEKKIKEIKEKKEKAEKEGAEALKKAKEETDKELTDTLKTLNEKEYDVEQDLLINEANKMHCLFELGLTFADPIKNISLDKLKEKATKAPSIAVGKIQAEIEEIKKYTPRQVLDKAIGKPIMNALAKKGMSETVLKSFKKDLLKQREDRRKKEMKEFSIEIKYPEEKNIDVDLFQFIKEEYKDFKEDMRKEIVKQLNKSIK